MCDDDARIRINRSILKCLICSKSWIKRDPRFLPCSHIFCLECLEKYEWKDDFSCPTCLLKFKLPKNGLSSLPKFIMFQQIMDVDEDSDLSKSDNYEEAEEYFQDNEDDDDNDEEDEEFGSENRKLLMKEEKYRILNLLRESKKEESLLLNNMNDYFEKLRKEVERQAEISRYQLMSAFKEKRRFMKNSMKAFDIFTSVGSFKEERENILKSCTRMRRKALDTEVVLKLREQISEMASVKIITMPSLSKFTMTKFIELDENLNNVTDCCVHNDEIYCLCLKNGNCVLSWYNLDGKFINDIITINTQTNNLSAISLTIDSYESIVFFVCQTRDSIYNYPLYRKDVTLTKFLNVNNVQSICSVSKGLLIAEGKENFSISLYQTNKLRLWTIKEESPIILISKAEIDDNFFIVTESNQFIRRNLKYGNRLTCQNFPSDNKCEKMIQFYTGVAVINHDDKSVIAINQNGIIDENKLKLEFQPTAFATYSKLFTDYLYIFTKSDNKNRLLIFKGN